MELLADAQVVGNLLLGSPCRLYPEPHKHYVRRFFVETVRFYKHTIR